MLTSFSPLYWGGTATGRPSWRGTDEPEEEKRGGRREVLKEGKEVGTVQRQSDKTIISIYKCKQIRRNSTNCGHKPENVLYLRMWRHVLIILSNIIIIPYFIPIIITTILKKSSTAFSNCSILNNEINQFIVSVFCNNSNFPCSWLQFLLLFFFVFI